MAERAELMAALKMFGGNEIHPDIFSSPEDKAALATTAMKGIETGEKLEAHSPRKQAKFIWDCLIVGSGDTVGFSSINEQVGSLSPAMQEKVNRLLRSEKDKAGPRYNDEPYVNLHMFARSGDVYGYVLSASWERKDQNGSWDAENFLGRQGELLKSSSGYTPPDPPDEA
jgi:hypothetical protein